MKFGDTLTLVSCSERSTKVRWVMPDGGSSTLETVYFIPPMVGTFTVKLYASNDDFVNEYEATKEVNVTP